MTEPINTPWGEIGYITYKRTYARRLNENDPNSPTEEFPQTVDRVTRGVIKQLKVPFTDVEQERFKEILLTLKGSVAGRFFWQLGTKTVDRLGLASLQNCAAVAIDDPIRPFCWAFDMLMLGSGVGANLQRKYVYKLPKVKKKKVKIVRLDTNDADYIIPDTREGWVKLLGKVLKAHFYSGEGFTYSTICIRGKGTVIKGFGGLASGPEDLVTGMDNICKVLTSRRGRQLRPIDCLDIMNIIGQIVVSGNVRRSAQIMLGDYDDLEFLSAKDWAKGNIPNWRAMSNNSVVCNDISKLPPQFWEGYTGDGEPYGLINMRLGRSSGRAGDERYQDTEIIGVNPCSEQMLENYETCALAEIHLPNIESKEELLEVQKYLYRVVKHSLALPCHHPETEAVVRKNMRMGIGVTGYLQATKKQQSWLKGTYEELRAYDESYSKEQGFPPSIKLLTVKPSGTLSLLSGVTPGAHPGFSHFFIRRMRMASNTKLVDVCRNNGYNVEYVRGFDGKEDRSTVVVEFPCKFPKNTTLAKDMSAVDQLEVVKKLQKEWSDNAVSVTIYYKLTELPAIKKWLSDNYNDSLKTVSFLLHSDHGFEQAPYEEITEEQYKEMKKLTKPITNVEIDEEDISSDQIGCASGACPIK